MHSLNQFAWISGTPAYQFGHRSLANVPITGAPEDADLTRWSMLHDGAVYRLYCGKRGHDYLLYQFGFDGAAYDAALSDPAPCPACASSRVLFAMIVRR